LLLFAAVTDRLANRVDMTGQGRFRNDSSTPYGIKQVVFADDAIVILQQTDQKIENLRTRRNHVRPTNELAPVGIERALTEHKSHTAPFFIRACTQRMRPGDGQPVRANHR
jgi:hypothetical protein